MTDCLICDQEITAKRLTVDAALGTEICQVAVCQRCIERIKRMPDLEFQLFQHLAQAARTCDFDNIETEERTNP